MNKNWKLSAVVINSLLAFTLLAAMAPSAPASTTDFESFNTGVSVNYQGPGGTMTYASVPAGYNYTVPAPYGSLWTVADEWGLGKITDPAVADFDEQVVVDGTGNKVWRFSNARTGAFSDQPNSPNSLAAAGETTAFLWNDRGLNHTTPTGPAVRAAPTTPYFHGSFRFKSATGVAQTDLTLNVSPTARQSDRRNSFVGLVDSGSGLNVTFSDTGIYPGAGGAGAVPFVGSTIATGLSYTDWHTIDIYVEFVDGLDGDGSGNDIVTVLVNDVVAHVGTTWETYYQVAFSTRPVGAVDALTFRASGTARPANLGNGFFFDDVVVDNAQLTSAEVLTCTGFQPPMDKSVSIKKKSNRVLPFKMQIVDATGVVQTDADIEPPVIEIDFGGEISGGLNGEDLLSTGKGDEGNQFSYNSADQTWQFNLNSKQFTALGDYLVTAVSGDPDAYSLAGCTATFIIQ